MKKRFNVEFGTTKKEIFTFSVDGDAHFAWVESHALCDFCKKKIGNKNKILNPYIAGGIFHFHCLPEWIQKQYEPELVIKLLEK